MPRFTSSAAGPARDLRALVATADADLAAWARERVPAAGVALCGEAAGAQHAVRLAAEFAPDLCLLDVALPGGAIAALGAIRDRAPRTRAVVLAAAADDPSLLPALRAGASGCLVGKPDGPALARALRDVLAGHSAIPRAVLRRLIAELPPA